MTTLKTLKEDLAPHKNTLVIINYDEIVKLIDVSQDEFDFYWVYESKTNGIQYSSCVLNFIPLKGAIKPEEYAQLVRIWNLNNTEKAI